MAQHNLTDFVLLIKHVFRHNRMVATQATIKPHGGQDACSNNVNLTDKEKECINHLMAGSYRKQVAFAMGIETRTVYAHIAQIKHKLSVRTDVELGCRLAQLKHL